MMSMKLSIVLIITNIIDRIINGISIISRTSESEAITLLENIDLSEKNEWIIINYKNIFILYKR